MGVGVGLDFCRLALVQGCDDMSFDLHLVSPSVCFAAFSGAESAAVVSHYRISHTYTSLGTGACRSSPALPGAST